MYIDTCALQVDCIDCPMMMSSVLLSRSVWSTLSISVFSVIFLPSPMVLVVSSCHSVVPSRPLCPFLIFLLVCSILVSLFSVPFVMSPVTSLGPVLFRVCACAASSQVTWPGTVRRPGARPVPVPVLLCLPCLSPPLSLPLCHLPCPFLFRLLLYRRLYLRPLLCHPPCSLQCHLSFLKMEKSPMGRAVPLHLQCPVLLLLLCRPAVLPLPGMWMSPCLRPVHPLLGQPSLLVPLVSHPRTTRGSSV